MTAGLNKLRRTPSDYGMTVTELPVVLVIHRCRPSKVAPSGPLRPNAAEENVPTKAPPPAASSVTELPPRLTTQRFVPSNAIPLGPLNPYRLADTVCT